MPVMWLDALTLRGRHVRLEPLAHGHLTGLCAAGLHASLWEWTTSVVRDAEDMRAYVDAALQAQREGSALPFATCDVASGKVIGSTRFANADFANRRIEIGWTWITPAFQRTPANTEAKYLMLRHAFEVLGCHRVELKTDALNQRSRTAMLRIGAREEGTLRRHMVSQGGRLRDTVYYSIILEEWPDVRARLEAWLARPFRARA